MEPYALSPSPDNADAKAAFRKLSNDAASRKYRRRSPVSGSSSSYGSPKREYSSSPIHSRGDLARDSDPRRKKDDGKGVDRDSGRNHHDRSGHSYRHSDRQSSRSSHNYHRRDEYVRHEKYTDEEERNYKSSRRGSVDTRSDRTRRESEHYRSRDHLQGDDKYSRDRSDGSGSRSRDKERETSSVEYQKYKDKDSLSYRAGSGRRNTNSNVEGMKSGEWDRHMGDGDGRDEKRDYRRSSGDYKSDRSPVYEESRSHRKEIAKSDPRELDGQKYTKEEKKKYDARETSRHKDQYDREPGELFEDKTSGSQESAAKKTKFSSGTDFVSKFTTVADERQSSSSKQAPELVGKLTSEQAPVKGSEAANDIDAAKVAAMKAAELVNKNLIGTGYMSTDQKKKLLWGNKKNTAAEESGHHWDSALFSDRERQEKFNKLMSLRLPWYLWPIVGCEGRRESGAKTRQSRKQQPPPSREAEGTAAGFGEAIHCWTPSKRWPNCWTRSLSLYSGDLCSCTTPFSSIVWYFLARILSFVIVDSWLVRGNCALPFLFEILDHDGKRCCMVYYTINLYICVCFTFVLALIIIFGGADAILYIQWQPLPMAHLRQWRRGMNEGLREAEIVPAKQATQIAAIKPRM